MNWKGFRMGVSNLRHTVLCCATRSHSLILRRVRIIEQCDFKRASRDSVQYDGCSPFFQKVWYSQIYNSV